MKYYNVMVDRTVMQWTQVSVEAETEAEARELALRDAAVCSIADWETMDETADDYQVTDIEIEAADNFMGQQQ